MTKTSRNLKLRASRIEKDLTQQELADQVGVARQTIGLIENGHYNPSLDLCIRVAVALDKTLNDLFWKERNDE